MEITKKFGKMALDNLKSNASNKTVAPSFIILALLLR